MRSFVNDAYTWLERAIAAGLLLGMVGVILLAAYSFLRMVVLTLPGIGGDLDYAVFQTLFDRLLAAVIALELAHSVHLMVTGQRGFVQVRAVLVIGILAIVRKLILVDLDETSGLFLMGLAAAIIALGGTFALLNWIEDRTAAERVPSPGSEE